jgi:DHA1 family multidrug resistance protein-like MFS transporter
VEGWRKGFAAICAAETLAIAGFYTSVPVLPFYIQDLGVIGMTAVNLWVGACSTILAVTLSVFAPIWGRLADSYGKRLMLLRSMVGGAVVMALMGLVAAPWQLLVLRGLQGALTGTVAAATVLVATTTPAEHVAYALGLLQTAVFVGTSIGPAVGGVIADLFGRRVIFFATGGMLLAAAFIILRFVPKDPPASRPQGPLWHRLIPDFSQIARSKSLIFILVILGMVQIAMAVVSPILPLFVQSILPSGARVATMTGLILALSAVSSALAAAGMGRVSGRFGLKKTLFLCLAGAFLLAAPRSLVRTPVQLLVLSVIGGAFLGGTLPIINALIAERAERSAQGTVYGLSSSVSFAGSAIGPMIGASVAAGFGYRLAFATAAALLLLTTVASLGFNRRQRRG